MWGLALACGAYRTAAAIQRQEGQWEEPREFLPIYGLTHLSPLIRLEPVAALLRELRARNPARWEELLDYEIFGMWDLDDIFTHFEASSGRTIRNFSWSVGTATQLNDEALVEHVKRIQEHRVGKSLPQFAEEDLVLVMFMARLDDETEDDLCKLVNFDYATALVRAGYKAYSPDDFVARWRASPLNERPQRDVPSGCVIHYMYTAWHARI